MSVATPQAAPPLWRESRLGLELAALLRDPVWRGRDVADGERQPVVLVPGFLAGDNSLDMMKGWLRRTGHRARRAGIRLNVDCANATVERLEERVEDIAAREGGRVAVVGQSRGGNLARVLAVRRPDLVAGIVTLGSPHLDPLAVHPWVRAQVTTVGVLGTLGAPRMFSRDCSSGDCCVGYRRDLAGAFPARVGFVSVYSRSDGIVDWRTCLDPGAEHVEIGSSHIGMALHPRAYRAVADALRRFRASGS